MPPFPARILLIVVLCCSAGQAGAAGESEKALSGWSVYIDNDFFSVGDNDRDYTGGFAFARSGARAKTGSLSIDSGLGAIDDWLGPGRYYHDPGYQRAHSQEFGLTLFTPADIKNSQPIPDEHPYASLFFINNSRLAIDTEELVAWQTTLTLGLLGLPLAGEIQQELHAFFGANEPEGWDNQISEGGEPTFRYSVSRSQKLLVSVSRPNLQVQTSIDASLGFTTDIGASIALRTGKVDSPWWSFNLHNAEYIILGSPTAPSRRRQDRESYLWLGASLKYRLYNALLQGQFRDSVVTFDRDELQQLVAEAWVGYTHEFAAGVELSVFVRARTQEIDLDDLHDPVWGGFILSRSY